jgi:hypothetical protein
MKRRLCQRLKLKLVYLRYGSLVDFSRHVKSISQVAKQASVPRPTVGHFLLRFERQGYRLNAISLSPSRRFEDRLPSALRGQIFSYEHLDRMKALSLRERCGVYRREYGIVITPNTLGVAYKRNMITYTSP